VCLTRSRDTLSLTLLKRHLASDWLQSQSVIGHRSADIAHLCWIDYNDDHLLNFVIQVDKLDNRRQQLMTLTSLFFQKIILFQNI